MKLRATTYTFDASAKTIDCALFTSLEAIQLITNVTDNVIIYNFADATKGGTLSGTVLTLTYDTTSMSDTDKLMILVEDGTDSVAIDDGGNSLTVDGTVAVTNAGLTALNGAISGTEVQVDIVSSALPSGAATSANQSTIIGHVDGIEGLLTTIDSDTGNLPTIETNTDSLTVVGGGLEATAQRVTIASDSTGVLSVDDNGSSLTVDGTVTANAGTGNFNVNLQDGLGTDITSTGGALDVNIASGSTSGTQYTEGDTDASITGTAVMWEDTSDTLRPVSASKPLPVNIVSGSASGTEYTEGDTDATLTGTIAMAEGPSNTATPLQVDASKHLQVDIAATSADITVQDGGGSLTVDNNGTFATQAAQSGTWNITNVSGTVSLPTGASTLAEQQSQTTHLSTIAGDTTSIQTAIELLDDTVATDGSATPTKGILMAGQDGTNAQTISTNSSGHINIADGGNTITVDGTVGVSGTVTADTELPTAVALADLSSNPTTTAVGSYLYAFDNGTGYNRLGLLNSGADGQSGGRGLTVGNMLFNGTSYDRERGDATNGTLVNLGSNNDVTVSNAAGASAVNIQDGGNTITVDYATTGSGTATGALRVELPTNGTGVIATVGAVTAITNALPAGTNAIGKLAANSGVDIGDVDVTSISAGSNLIGDVGIQPRTTNGLDTFMASGSDGSSILVATAQAVKASAGKVYGYYIYNPESAVTFVHFYNTSSGSVTVGTTNPLFTLPIPAGSAANLMSEIGITFGTAITVAATTTAGGNTAPSTGVSATIWFK